MYEIKKTIVDSQASCGLAIVNYVKYSCSPKAPAEIQERVRELNENCDPEGWDKRVSAYLNRGRSDYPHFSH